MKCKKCGHNMKRMASDEHHYYYECTQCRNIVGKTIVKEGENDGGAQSESSTTESTS